MAGCLACPKNQTIELLDFACVERIQQSSSVSRNNQSICALDCKLREKNGMKLPLYSSVSYHGWLSCMSEQSTSRTFVFCVERIQQSSIRAYARLIVYYERRKICHCRCIQAPRIMAGWLAGWLSCMPEESTRRTFGFCLRRTNPANINPSICALDCILREKKDMPLPLYSSALYHGWLAGWLAGCLSVLHARRLLDFPFVERIQQSSLSRNRQTICALDCKL